MKMALALGGEFDIASGDEVRAAADSAADGLFAKLNRGGKRPVYAKRSTSVTLPTPNTGLAIRLESPPANRLWMVFRVAASLITVTAGATTIGPAVSAGMVFQGNVPTQGNLPGAADYIASVDALGVWDPQNPQPVYHSDALYLWTTTAGSAAPDSKTMVVTMWASEVDIDAYLKASA